MDVHPNSVFALNNELNYFFQWNFFQMTKRKIKWIQVSIYNQIYIVLDKFFIQTNIICVLKKTFCWKLFSFEK